LEKCPSQKQPKIKKQPKNKPRENKKTTLKRQELAIAGIDPDRNSPLADNRRKTQNTQK